MQNDCFSDFSPSASFSKVLKYLRLLSAKSIFFFLKHLFSRQKSQEGLKRRNGVPLSKTYLIHLPNHSGSNLTCENDRRFRRVLMWKIFASLLIFKPLGCVQVKWEIIALPHSFLVSSRQFSIKTFTGHFIIANKTCEGTAWAEQRAEMTIFLEHPVLGPSHCSAMGAELPRQECSLEGKSFVTAYWKARRNQQALARRQSLETGVDRVKGRQFTTEEGNSDKWGANGFSSSGDLSSFAS